MREATIRIPDEALSDLGIGEFVPAAREVGVERVTELGIDPSTVRERLQRARHHLVAGVLDVGGPDR